MKWNMLSKSLEKTEEQKSYLVLFQVLVGKYKKYYSSHWKVVKTPDQSQKLSNNQLSKAKFRGRFSAKKLSNLALSNNQFWLHVVPVGNHIEWILPLYLKNRRIWILRRAGNVAPGTFLIDRQSGDPVVFCAQLISHRKPLASGQFDFRRYVLMGQLR